MGSTSTSVTNSSRMTLRLTGYARTIESAVCTALLASRVSEWKSDGGCRGFWHAENGPVRARTKRNTGEAEFRTRLAFLLIIALPNLYMYMITKATSANIMACRKATNHVATWKSKRAIENRAASRAIQ